MDAVSYEIKPIFRPSKEICGDFARIQIARLSNIRERLDFYKNVGKDYFDTLEPDEKLIALKEWQQLFVYAHLDEAYLNTWNIEKNVFAFGAYSDGKMVGFITGSSSGKNMFTRSLYVMPEYQGYGIGSDLLDCAECAASCVASNMELFSLAGAVTFYQGRGYQNVLVLGRLMKVKKLSKARGVIPVFQWCDKLQAKLNVKVDYDLLKRAKYQPIFVYVNDEDKIDAVAIRMQNGKEKIKINAKKKDLSEFYIQKLSDALIRSL